MRIVWTYMFFCCSTTQASWCSPCTGSVCLPFPSRRSCWSALLSGDNQWWFLMCRTWEVCRSSTTLCIAWFVTTTSRWSISFLTSGPMVANLLAFPTSDDCANSRNLSCFWFLMWHKSLAETLCHDLCTTSLPFHHNRTDASERLWTPLKWNRTGNVPNTSIFAFIRYSICIYKQKHEKHHHQISL